MCNDSFYPFLLCTYSHSSNPYYAYLDGFLLAYCDIWYVTEAKQNFMVLAACEMCIKLIEEIIQKLYPHCDDTRLDSWTRSLNIRRKVGRKMSDTLGSITAITYSESRNVSNFPEFISPYCPEIQIQNSYQRFVALRNTEHKCCMQSRHVSNV